MRMGDPECVPLGAIGFSLDNSVKKRSKYCESQPKGQSLQSHQKPGSITNFRRDFLHVLEGGMVTNEK